MPNQPLTSDPYGNFKVLNQDGNLIFRCGKKKMNWYLGKGLAEIVEPDTIKLNFETKGPGHMHEAAFYLDDKENKCVVCGSEEELTKHHVVPYCYRKHLDDRYKNKCYYDILILCVKCHIEYERYVHRFREHICLKYDVPINGYPPVYDSFLNSVRKCSRIYRVHKDKLPPDRLSEIENVLFAYFGKSEISEDELISGESVNGMISSHVTHGELVISKLSTLQEIDDFFKLWRNHFVKEMNPQHLPDGWTVDRNLLQERLEREKWVKDLKQ